MASFNGFILTNKGRELLAKAVAGETLTFTKMETGDGTFTGDVRTLTSLVNKKDDFNINQIENQGNGQVVLKSIISNKNTTTGYYIREMGMFAHGDDNVEILYAYNKAIEADYFPAFNSSNVVEVEYQNIIIIDQAQNVTAVIDPSLTYITKEEAEIRILESLGYLAGASYNGVFGTDLTSIKAGNSYLYKDSNGKGTIYLALKDATNASGFLIPDTANFYNLSSVYTKNELDRLIRTKEVVIQSYPGLGDSKFIRIGKVCFFSMFLQGSGFSLTDGHIITPFPTNFYPDNSFLLPRPAEFSIESNFTDSNANVGRIVFGVGGPQIYGVGGKTITELKGTITYINNL